MNFKSTIKIVLYSIALIGITFAITVNYYNTNIDTHSEANPAINLTEGSFTVAGNKYINVEVTNIYLSPDGKLSTLISAQNAATSDTVTFASQAIVEPTKWGEAKWDKSKWE